MEEGEIVFRLFIPTNENTPETVHPTMSTFNDPTPCTFSCFFLQFFGFFATGANMRSESKFTQSIAHIIKIITSIHADVLFFLRRWLWAFDHNLRQGFVNQFHVVTIGSCNRQANGNSLAFGQQTAFDTAFRSVRWIGADFFPRPAVLWSLHHPGLAIPSRFPLFRRTFRRLLATISRRLQPQPILENDHAPLTWRVTLSHSGFPIAHRCAIHRRWRLHIFDPVPAVVLR